MDYYGQVLDDITDIWETITRSPNAADGKPVLQALERAMRAAVRAEALRTRRLESTIALRKARFSSSVDSRAA